MRIMAWGLAVVLFTMGCSDSPTGPTLVESAVDATTVTEPVTAGVVPAVHTTTVDTPPSPPVSTEPQIADGIYGTVDPPVRLELGVLEWRVHVTRVTRPFHFRKASYHTRDAGCRQTDGPGGGKMTVVGSDSYRPGDAGITIIRWTPGVSCGCYQIDWDLAYDDTGALAKMVGDIVDTGEMCPVAPPPPPPPPVVPPPPPPPPVDPPCYDGAEHPSDWINIGGQCVPPCVAPNVHDEAGQCGPPPPPDTCECVDAHGKIQTVPCKDLVDPNAKVYMDDVPPCPTKEKV